MSTEARAGDRVNRGPKGKGGRRWKTSDTPLTAEEQSLAAEWVPVAKSFAKQFASGRDWLADEFESAAMYALLDAARNFDPSRKTSFFTYLRWHLLSSRNAVLKRHSPRGYRDSKQGGDPPRIGGLDDSDDLAVEVGAEADVDVRDFVYKKLAGLPDRYAAVCREIYFSGRRPREIASAWGCRVEEVRRLHETALRVMRGEVDADSLDATPPTPATDPFGEWVRTMRRARGLSRLALARLIYCNPKYLVAVERGRERANRRVREALCCVLGRGGGVAD